MSGALAFAFGAFVFGLAYLIVKEIFVAVEYLTKRGKHGSED